MSSRRLENLALSCQAINSLTVEERGTSRVEEWIRLAKSDDGATAASLAAGGPAYRHLFVDQQGFEAHRPTTFQGLVKTFRSLGSERPLLPSSDH